MNSKDDRALLPGLREALLWKPNTPQLENAMTYAWESALKSFISAIEKNAPRSATQRSEPDAAALRYLLDSTAPDGQWADQAVHNFVGAMLKQSPPPATQRSEPVTDEMVEKALAAANGTIVDTRRFWTYEDKAAVRAMLESALSETPAGGTAKVPEEHP